MNVSEALRALDRWRATLALRQRSSAAPAAEVVLSVRQQGRHVPFLVSSLMTSFGSLSVTRDSHTSVFKAAAKIARRSGSARLTTSRDEYDSISIGPRTWRLVYDYYRDRTDAFFLPFYEHPTWYLSPPPASRPVGHRSTRIAFAGSGLTPPYENQYRFPTMNRNEVLRAVSEFLAERRAEHRAETPEVRLVINQSEGNTTEKHTLSQGDYYSLLRQSDFFLCPPGLRIPHSHNYVEAMRNGAIPIINYNDYLHPSLTDRRNALVFTSPDEARTAIELALGMHERDIHRMREEVKHYHDEFLAPGDFWTRRCADFETATTLVVPVSVASPEASGMVINE